MISKPEEIKDNKSSPEVRFSGDSYSFPGSSNNPEAVSIAQLILTISFIFLYKGNIGIEHSRISIKISNV